MIVFSYKFTVPNSRESYSEVQQDWKGSDVAVQASERDEKE